MKLKEAKAKIEAKRASLREKSGHMVASSENGPIGIDMIDALLVVIEDQQKRIEELEKRPITRPGQLSGQR
jgi:hypothetical protein